MEVVSRLRPLILGDNEVRESDTEREALKKCFRSFRRDFLVGAAFAATREALASLSATSPPTIFRAGFGENVLLTSFQLSLFPLVDGVARAHFRPQIKTVPQWMWWTVKTSAVTSAILKFLQVTVKPKDYPMTVKKFAKSLPMPIATGVGFELGSGLAQMYLPKANQMGGSFARNAAALTIADGVSTACALPFVEKGNTGYMVRAWLGSVPLILYDAALYSVVRHTVKSRLR